MDNLDPKIVAALIAAVVSVITFIITLTTKNFLERKLHIRKLEADHEYEQRKSIKAVLSKYKVHLLNSCESLNHRMWNFANNHSKEWLKVDHDYDSNKYYIISFSYRIIVVYYWINKIEKELIFLDSTISTKTDLDFIKYLKLFQRTLTDIKLFEGLYSSEEYATYPKDHFYANELEAFVNYVQEDGELINFEKFKIKVDKSPDPILKILNFLDGLSPNESRPRWERIHSLNLVLILFLNSFGYDFQKTSNEQLTKTLEFPRKSKVQSNFLRLLKNDKLEYQKEVKQLIKKLIK